MPCSPLLLGVDERAGVAATPKLPEARAGLQFPPRQDCAEDGGEEVQVTRERQVSRARRRAARGAPAARDAPGRRVCSGQGSKPAPSDPLLSRAALSSAWLFSIDYVARLWELKNIRGFHKIDLTLRNALMVTRLTCVCFIMREFFQKQTQT